MKGYENAINALDAIRGMSEGDKYYDRDARIPLVYVRQELTENGGDDYHFIVGIRGASSEIKRKYDYINDKVFDTAQEAADYIIAIAEKENGGSV